jgi:sterol desaturase/sphingolipid hydroxylase (fatty acid hydroxylase superfamily)
VSVENQAGSLELAAGASVKTASGIDGPACRALIAFGYYFAIVGYLAYSMDRILPERIAVTFFGHDFAIEHLQRHIVAAGSFGLVMVPAAFVVELVLVDWPKCSLRHLLFTSSASSRSDVVGFLLCQSHATNFCKPVLTFGVALLSGVWLHDYLRTQTGLNLTLRGAPAPVVYVGYFLLFTFLDYWTHRLDHTHRFWPIHRYHHAARDFCILTSDRGHPANFTSTVATVVPLGLLDMPPQVAFWIYLVVGAEHLLIHSRIDSDLGWIGRYVVQSPVHHRLHHTLDTTKPTAHFSLIPLWDHLFGTWQGGGSQQIAIGVSDPYKQGIWVVPDLWRDYREFLTGFVRRRPGALPSPESPGSDRR